jgi:polar amino acid transport system substrate-binding protein
VRIAVAARTAYGLWLDRNIQRAELVHSDSLDASFEQFQRDGLDALAGLKPRLLQDVDRIPGARIIEGQFAAVQQAVGTLRQHEAGAAFLREFVAEAIRSGLVARLIDKHQVNGLSVAPLA